MSTVPITDPEDLHTQLLTEARAAVFTLLYGETR